MAQVLDLRHLCQRQNAGDRWRNPISKKVVCAMYVPKNDLFFAIFCLGLRPQLFLNIKLPFGDIDGASPTHVSVYARKNSEKCFRVGTTRRKFLCSRASPCTPTPPYARYNWSTATLLWTSWASSLTSSTRCGFFSRAPIGPGGFLKLSIFQGCCTKHQWLDSNLGVPLICQNQAGNAHIDGASPSYLPTSLNGANEFPQRKT